jgi:sterol 3beta-glucosyltransferase
MEHPVMKMMLLTAGTRGDVEPFLALARAAVARGHQVRIAVPDNSGADTAGLGTVSLRMDFAQLISDQGVTPWAAGATFRKLIRPAMGRLLSAAVEHIIAFSPDVVVYHPKVLSAPTAAERLRVPAVLVETVPLTPTGEFPAAFLTTANLGPLNRATYRVTNVANLMFRDELNTALQMLPAGPRQRAGTRYSMVPVSPHLLPRPSDWPAEVHLTGHWNGKPAAVEADEELEDFMNRGDFVYAGFGSMKTGDATRRGETVVEAARRNGLNILVAGGWGGIEIPTRARAGDVLVRDSVNHHHVLPRAAAAIHHGGAGTVHAVARAGIPSVVVPFIADQPFWGNLLHRSGLAPEPIRYRKLTADRLTAAISQTRGMRDRAAQAGDLIRREDGTAVALDVLETLAGS